jgi:tricorn protease
MKKLLFVVAILTLAFTSVFAQADKPTLFRQPTVNKTHVVFVYAGDLWKVTREGGTAERLTSGVGNESNPVFSPDGNWIAFSGEYDGNIDVYLVSANGGEPRRLTYHPSPDTAIGWTPDGQSVVFLSNQSSAMITPKMFKMNINGEGLPSELPFPMAGGGASFSPDGSKIAYMPLAPAFQQWKKYRGGRTTKIWIGSLADSSVEEIPKQNSNDYTPMWIDDKIYFLSDRNIKNTTLFSFDTKSKKVAEAIKNEGLDLKTASTGAGVIVYEQFGSINLFDPKSGKSNKININLNGDLAQVRPRYERVAGRISNASISPTGARAVFEARGEILSVPAEKGNARNLTNSSGVADRDPAWSPDGKWIAYFSDASGNYELHLRDQSGMGEVKKINLGPPSYFYEPKWSPDSKKIAYRDKRLNLWYVDIEKGTPVKVDTNTYENPFSVMDFDWSPDSKWVTYSKQLRNRLCAIFVYSLDPAKTNQITDGLSDARFPVFDRGGKHIFFAASTDTGPTTGWLDMSATPFEITRSIYAVVLRKDDPSPLAPESDEEKIDDGKPAMPKMLAAKPESVSVTIDFERITQRIVNLPMAARNYSGLRAGKAGTLFLLENVPSSGTGGTPNFGAAVHRFDTATRKTDKILDGVTLLNVSANGEKMLVGQFPGRYTIMSTFLPPRPGEGNVNIGEMEVYIDPRAEWKQMYREVWRIQRDFFYEPTFHGLDIAATEKRYEIFLDSIASRSDLNYLFQEMLGNFSIGHHNSGGGDSPQPIRYTVGLLGADYKIENGRYRFAKIYDGENWNPGTVAPLTQPGVNVKEGEYLLAVNGNNLTGKDNIYAFFEAKAGKQTIIKVAANPDGKDSRNVTVVPIANEGGLRNLSWIEENRRKVGELSSGKLAYVYLPNTGGAGYTNFNRYYFAQIDKEGAVIDERFNGGGSAADYFIDVMKRPLMNYWSTREGENFQTPVHSILGPKTMMINEYSSSGGDALPWMFRKAKVGQLVGRRTWGGLVGIYDYPTLIDGGSVTAPRVAFRDVEGNLDVENKGVAPDIDIDLDPKLWRAGRDSQLEKAVQVTLDSLQKNPIVKPKNGPAPNYQKQQFINNFVILRRHIQWGIVFRFRDTENTEK